MPYNSSPYAPRARREAVNLVLRQGLTKAEAARRTGVHRSTIGKWLRKAEAMELHWKAYIPTLKPVAHHHPRALSDKIVSAIIEERRLSGRCAEIIQLELAERGVKVSLSSVSRTLKRHGLTKDRTKWKTKRTRVKRPIPNEPGALVQVDTIHFRRSDGSKFYVYTMIDLYSRAAYAEYSLVCNESASLAFVLRGRDYLGINISMLQTDNGGEFLLRFGQWLDQLSEPIPLRHSRVRQSNDNAHVERFNRTLEDECLSKHPREDLVVSKLEDYLIYYNQFRRHLGINGNYPGDLLLRV
jgi:transposase InsO family protein